MSSSEGRPSPSADTHSVDSLDYEALASSLQREGNSTNLLQGNPPNISDLSTMGTPSVAGSSGVAAAAAGGAAMHHVLTTEELCFSSALTCFEGYLKLDSGIGPKTMAYVTKLVTRTLEKTHHLKDVRYVT